MTVVEFSGTDHEIEPPRNSLAKLREIIPKAVSGNRHDAHTQQNRKRFVHLCLSENS